MALTDQTTTDSLDQLYGAAVIEFGAAWCGYCQQARTIIDEVLTQHSSIRHIKIEDGQGQRLGRIYKVKLWPTLIFLQDGTEIIRLVRPANTQMITDAINKLIA